MVGINEKSNAPLHLPPTLASLLPKTKTLAASERAHTRAEGGQVQAVVRRLKNHHLETMFQIVYQAVPTTGFCFQS